MSKNKISYQIRVRRVKSGFSQEELAEKSGLSLRTVQRIENGETDPRGDSLKRIAKVLGVSPEYLIDWELEENSALMTLLHLSQLGFIAFPILGIVIPLTIWILKKSRIKNVDRVGQQILNFQITWSISAFLLYITAFSIIIIFRRVPVFLPFSFFPLLGILYLYNIGIIVYNTLHFKKSERLYYRPSIKFLKPV